MHKVKYLRDHQGTRVVPWKAAAAAERAADSTRQYIAVGLQIDAGTLRHKVSAAIRGVQRSTCITYVLAVSNYVYPVTCSPGAWSCLSMIQ